MIDMIHILWITPISFLIGVIYGKSRSDIVQFGSKNSTITINGNEYKEWD